MPYLPDDPIHLTPEQRRREIAAILARGILRLRPTRQLSPQVSSGTSTDVAVAGATNTTTTNN